MGSQAARPVPALFGHRLGQWRLDARLQPGCHRIRCSYCVDNPQDFAALCVAGSSHDGRAGLSIGHRRGRWPDRPVAGLLQPADGRRGAAADWCRRAAAVGGRQAGPWRHAALRPRHDRQTGKPD